MDQDRAAGYPFVPGTPPLTIAGAEGNHLITTDGRRILDGAGGAFLLGYFSDSVTVDGSLLTSAGSYDYLLARYSVNGKRQMLKRFGDTNIDISDDLVADHSGNLYVSGNFRHGTSFGGPPVSGNYGPDVLVASTSSSGTHRWSLGFGTIMNGVYFGTDANEVANGIGAPPYLETTFDPELLATGTTYYWRVDTFNGSEWLTGPVWSFTTMPDIPISADPNLVASWTLDEGAGANALDWSGHGNHGMGVIWCAN